MSRDQVITANVQALLDARGETAWWLANQLAQKSGRKPKNVQRQLLRLGLRPERGEPAKKPSRWTADYIAAVEEVLHLEAGSLAKAGTAARGIDPLKHLVLSLTDAVGAVEARMLLERLNELLKNPFMYRLSLDISAVLLTAKTQDEAHRMVARLVDESPAWASAKRVPAGAAKGRKKK